MNRHNVALLLTCATSLAGGLFLSSGLFYMSNLWNDAVVISDVQAAAEITTRAHERWLEVHYHATSVKQCPSWTQHTIYRDTKVLGRDRTVMMPLGITVNGLGAPRMETDFDIPFHLPDGLTPGDWYYTAITSTSCEWLPGLVRQRVQETEPIPVTIPPAR